jgi:mRNA-degrading endonuclease RelE of RelBE toxin-antitoxin system
MLSTKNYRKHSDDRPRRGRRKEEGDVKALTDELEGFYRLRVGSHRVVFEHEIIETHRVVTCVFARSKETKDFEGKF